MKEKENKEMELRKVMEEDPDSFSKLLLTIGLIQASKAINELIKIIIEDNSNKKEEENDKEIN